MDKRCVNERPHRVVMDDQPFAHRLAAAQGGDGRAFAQLFESMNRRVFAFVSYRGARDPEGMVNDVFLKVFTNLSTFEGNEVQFSAWIFKIARNRLIDESRARKRRPAETSLDPGDRVDDSAAVTPRGNTETEALGNMELDWVLDQLDALTPDQRDVVVMRIVSDLTIEAIADALGKRVGAVKAIQRRAFRTLAKNFDSEAVPQ